ncbi:hypothetical protein I79_015492 [Cricetulus griseus]|uniref:Uncharacterized protein n=1 Tax=Cricetulus griseus TaxID=10029 RepID=G3HWX7_CRIGR|nr:hypothetical protein I79_015492 [Cricetulus griseus]
MSQRSGVFKNNITVEPLNKGQILHYLFLTVLPSSVLSDLHFIIIQNTVLAFLFLAGFHVAQVAPNSLHLSFWLSPASSSRMLES